MTFFFFQSPKPKARGKPKKTPAKKQKTPKKPAKKRSRKEDSDSDSESSEDPEPQRKKPKPAARTKKADSSSNSKTPPVKDSSDEDKPLSKMMMKKNPSDDQLTETVKSLLKEADLEELTMKQICQKVFDVYSDHDLSSRKDFIKQTVRSLIT
ncbi:unnamed protein product [Knipowitschia caucasica]|uniref:DEK-C domain-containing protein n=1 Tax=Knipowitschia caucasica TaxID=637954 RepID=A0AAV2MGE3_KNICA